MRVISWLCFSLLSAVLTASVSSAGERDLRARKFVQMGCERGIEKWSKTAEGLGKLLSEVQEVAKTNSSKAKVLLDGINRHLEEIENNAYLAEKEFIKHMEKHASQKYENVYERDSYLSLVKTSLVSENTARLILFEQAFKVPGKSATYYARMAEIECLAD